MYDQRTRCPHVRLRVVVPPRNPRPAVRADDHQPASDLGFGRIGRIPIVVEGRLTLPHQVLRCGLLFVQLGELRDEPIHPKRRDDVLARCEAKSVA
jgi:hypothetical protein